MTPSATTEQPTANPTTSDNAGRLSAWESLSFAAAHLVVSGMLGVFRLGGLYHFGRAFGTVEYALDRKRRRRFHNALARILEREPTRTERRKWTRRFFMEKRCDKLFYLVLDRLSREQAASLLIIDNEPLLKRCVERGHGVLFALSHLGSQHSVGVLLASQGYHISGVRDGNESGMRRFVQNRLDNRRDASWRIRMLFAGSFARDILRCYRDGYIMDSALDINRVRDENQRVEYADMFGEKRPFLTGPMRIALRCKAPVLHGFVVPESHFRYRFELVGMLIDPENLEDEEAAISQAVQAYAQHLEARLKKHPSLITRI